MFSGCQADTLRGSGGERVGETQSVWHPTGYEPCVIIFYELIIVLVIVTTWDGEVMYC